jgi:hypothetical protein
MKFLIAAVGVVCFTASMASAEVVSVNQDTFGNSVVAINGPGNGLAQEIFTRMEQAGVPSIRHPDGENLIGTHLKASQSTFTGKSHFGVTMTIDPSSTFSMDPNDVTVVRSIVVNGDVAAELFSDLQKSGLLRTGNADRGQIDGKNISCLLLYRGHAGYHCTLLVSPITE